MAGTWRFDGQHVFLTYPQSTLSWQQIIDHLRTIGELEWARVCTESHADGNPHQHCVAKFSRRIQLRSAAAFDVGGQHPNIQSVRSVKKSLAYVSKDGEFTDVGPVPAGHATEPKWVVLAAELDRGEYFEEARKWRLPYQYATEFWELGRKQSCEVGVDYEADMSREQEELHDKVPDDDGTTVIIGPSGIGKTSWAKRVCKKPGLWVRHIDVLRSFRKGYHKSVIFDDMSFSHQPHQAQIHLVDKTDETHIHCRYGHATIPAFVQRIFTGNEYPFSHDPAAAIARRVKLINLYR